MTGIIKYKKTRLSRCGYT